jgi:hypothetical protein
MNYSEDQLRVIIDTIPTLAWSTGPDGSAEFLNQRWLDYTGLSAQEALDRGWKVAIHPDDLSRILEIFQEALNSGRPFKVEGPAFAAATANFAGFFSATALCAMDREKSSNGTGRIPILTTGSARRRPSARANRV